MHKSLLKSLALTLALSALLSPAFSQKSTLENAGKLSDSLYKAKQFALATPYYGIVAEQSDFKNKKAGAYYNMACCLRQLQTHHEEAVL